jgi:hypothetical protein
LPIISTCPRAARLMGFAQKAYDILAYSPRGIT